jgi:hypothetical protein
MKYTIQPGHSFLDSDGKTKAAGDTIELADDVAAANRDKVQPVIPEAPAAEAADTRATRKA